MIEVRDLIGSTISDENEYKALHPYNDKTILIQIPSYKDKDVLNTVYSALQQANFPERIHFAICYQDDDIPLLHRLKSIPNMKIMHVLPKDARGACYARWCCQQLIDWDNPQDFTLHTDSHMRFAKGWDDLIIEKYMQYYESDPKAIMSTYPPSSNKWLDKKFDDPVYDLGDRGVAMCAGGFHHPNGHFIKLIPQGLEKDDPRNNARNVFVSGGYFFSAIGVDKVVLYDKHMLQLGDELPYSVRLFTYGYNIYMPDATYIYHEYTRPHRQAPVMSQKDHIEEFCRVDTLFEACPVDKRVDLGEFGLGTERTLDEYMAFSGINFKKHTIAIKAIKALYGENEPPNGNDVDIVRQREAMLHDMLKSYKIHLVIFNLFDKKYDNTSTAAHALDKAEHPDFINVIEIDHDKDAPYGSWQKKAMDELQNQGADDNDYILFVDNSARFIDTWDVNFIISQFESGDRAVLSNTDVNIGPDRDIDKLPIFDNFAIKLCDVKYPSFRLAKSSMIMSQTIPTRHMFVTHGVLFMKYSILKEVPFIDDYSYTDFIITYSARLFTFGYDIYYPVHSRIMRYELETTLYDRDEAHVDNRRVKFMFKGDHDLWTDDISLDNLTYGTARTIKQFAKEIGFNASENKFSLDKEL